MEGRHSNLFDQTSLRLHPDGTRVKTGIESRGKSADKANLSLRQSKYTTKDYLGNWIATDASGTENIKHRYHGKRAVDDQLHEREDEIDPSLSPESRQNAKNEERGERDRRARKRRKFYEDLSFLDEPVSFPETSLLSGQSVVPERSKRHESLSSSSLPIPSSELLKCVHFFASEYYTARGCLYNEPRRSRAIKKARRQEKSSRGKADSIEQLSNKNQEHHSGEQSPDEGDDSTETHRVLNSSERKRSKQKLQRDMYRSFDGTALMAIGMLLQEHIAYYVSKEIHSGNSNDGEKNLRAIMIES